MQRQSGKLTARALAVVVLVMGCMGASTAGVLAQSGSTRGELGNGGRSVIKGRIYLPSGGSNIRAKVKLVSTRRGDEINIMSDGSGAFAFDGLVGGEYRLTVDAGDDFEIATEEVMITDFRRVALVVMVPVYLTPKKKPRQPGPGVVPVNALGEGIPDDARKQYDLAVQAAARGDGKAAIDLYKKAIAAHPKFYAAHNELGLQYMKAGEIDEAIDALRGAVSVDPRVFDGQLNLGAALLEDRRFQEARGALEAAVGLDASSPKAHLYLGITLIGLRDLKGAERELSSAVKLGGEEVSAAHYYLGGIYMAWRQKERAAEELETYLREAPKPKDPERVRRTIAELRGKA